MSEQNIPPGTVFERLAVSFFVGVVIFIGGAYHRRPPVDIGGTYHLRPSVDTGLTASITVVTKPRYLRIVGSGTVLVEIDMETGVASLSGDPNEAARIFWAAVTNERMNK